MTQTYKFMKKEALTQVFSREFCEILKNTIFYRTPSMAASNVQKVARGFSQANSNACSS